MPPKGWKKPEPVTGPVSQETADAIMANAIAEAPPENNAIIEVPVGVIQNASRPKSYGALPMTPLLRQAIQESNVIQIVCKTTRPNDDSVTITSSRHDAKWLKGYV